MKPLEKKAKEKAQKLLDEINLSIFEWGGMNDIRFSHVVAIKICEENIETLSEIKGLSKMGKLNFWKLVKENLQNG